MGTKDEIFYELCIGDIQDVATQSFGRELTADEIKKILDPIGESIPWYDIILETIRWKLGLEEVEQEEDI